MKPTHYHDVCCCYNCLRCERHVAMGAAGKVTKHGHFYCNAYDFGMDKSNAFYNVCDDWAVRKKEES